MSPSAVLPGDSPPDAMILRALPRSLRPYALLARLDRPIGTWLLLFPCWWGILISPGILDHPGRAFGHALLFAVGALVMRGAGCTYNDIVDRDIDARVARTRGRPLPSGAVSVAAAVLFMVVQMAVGAIILASFNRFTFWLGVLSLALVFIYPFMKRVTWWPQAWLGLAFNWGALMGYAAETGRLDAPAFVLYGAGILWTLGYDTIYALQDREDDALVGIRSTARKFGDDARRWIVSFYIGTVVLLLVAGVIAGMGTSFYAVLALAAAQLAWQASSIQIDSPADCLAKFRSNRLFGWLIAAALLLGHATAP
ncbi:MAG: 4-hydroxybenzoate octaprenyltransferase [Gemmatimonas sp.]